MKEDTPLAASEQKASSTQPGIGSLVLRWATSFVFWLAIPSLIVLVATLMAGHLVLLPKPSASDDTLRRELSSLRDYSDQRMWMAVHVLYSECGCSRRVLEHIFESERPKNVREKLLLVGAHPEFEAGAGAAGLKVQVLEPRELKERYGLESAPLFIVADPTGELRYIGGYTERKRGLVIRDVEIMSSLSKSEQVSELPLFGCAVSESLQALLDPLGLKYSQK